MIEIFKYYFLKRKKTNICFPNKTGMVRYHSSLVEQRKKILVSLVRPDSYRDQQVHIRSTDKSYISL